MPGAAAAGSEKEAFRRWVPVTRPPLAPLGAHLGHWQAARHARGQAQSERELQRPAASSATAAVPDTPPAPLLLLLPPPCRLEAKRFTASDVPGCRIASRMLLLLLLLRTTIIEHLYGLAAIGVLQCAVLESLALLACHHPRWYARHRHWLLTLGLAQLSLTIHLLTIRGGMNIFALAGGSPALLLFWLSVGNSSLYTAICSMNSHLRVAWSCWALPALGLLAVRRSDQLCTQLARAPGTSEALDQLYCMLALLHGLPMPLLAHLSLHVLPESRKCHAVNTWTTFMLGVVVPLLIQAYWEKARWRAYWQQHWRQQAAAAAEPAGGNPAAAALAAAATEEEAPSGEAWHALMSSGQRWPIELLLCSSLVWCLSILTQA